jgi:rubrerythrin
MIGAICTWDIVSHPLVTVQCFGWRTLLRVLTANKQQTFLSLLGDSGVLCPTDPEAAAILNQCIGLELRAEALYLTLAEATAEEPTLSLFFATLAQQEQDHAELLRLCAAASARSDWWRSVLLAQRDDVIRLDQEMRDVEESMSAIDDVDAALRLVIQIESSEINRVFLAAMAASNSAFVKKLRPFQKAVETHLNYIRSQLSTLAPHLAFERETPEPSCCGEG